MVCCTFATVVPLADAGLTLKVTEHFHIEWKLNSKVPHKVRISKVVLLLATSMAPASLTLTRSKILRLVPGIAHWAVDVVTVEGVVEQRAKLNISNFS